MDIQAGIRSKVNPIIPVLGAGARNIILLVAILVLSYTTRAVQRTRVDPPLVRAIKAGDVKRVAVLLAFGRNPNAKDKDGWPAIMCIVYAPVVSQMSGEGHSGGITITRHKNHRSIVELLVKYGANVNVKTTSGWTPLMQAQTAGDDELMAFLKRAGEKK